MKRYFLLLLVSALPAFAEEAATGAPVRTLKEADSRVWEYSDNLAGETLRAYAVKIGTGEDGGPVWTFSCESECRVKAGENKDDGGFDWGEGGEAVWRYESVDVRVDSSGAVRELRREASEKVSFPRLWIPIALNYCEAAGIDPDSLSELAVDDETSMVFTVGTNAPLRVSHGDIARTEQAHFFETIAGADRIVVRDGGFDCCTSIEAIDRQRVFAVITNAHEIAAFAAMIRFEEEPGFYYCMCCGHPGIDWWKDGERVALTSVHHGEGLRWRAFSGDYPFTGESSKALAEWMEAHGISAD